MPVEHNSQGVGASRSRKPCPLHGPHLVDVVEESFYVARCLVCGLVGPVRKEVPQAKLAFDQRWHEGGRLPTAPSIPENRVLKSASRVNPKLTQTSSFE
jgi:hypothetical protein